MHFLCWEKLYCTCERIGQVCCAISKLCQFHTDRKPLDAEATKAWAPTNAQLVGHLADLDATAKHLNDISRSSRCELYFPISNSSSASLSAVNQARQIKNLSLRHAPIPDAEEHAAFPNTIIPYQQNEDFYGRSPEMGKIISCLSPSDENDLRTYTIYGRRGVGK